MNPTPPSEDRPIPRSTDEAEHLIDIFVSVKERSNADKHGNDNPKVCRATRIGQFLGSSGSASDHSSPQKGGYGLQRGFSDIGDREDFVDHPSYSGASKSDSKRVF